MRTIVERIEWAWRHAIVYPALRFILRNKQTDGVLDLSAVRSILILRYDKIGDMIVTKPIFRILKKRNPQLTIGVVTSESNAEIIANDRNVDERYILQSNWAATFCELWRARKRQYDMVLNFIFNRTTTGGLIANFVAPRGVKVGQGAEKYRFYFNKLLTLTRSSSHMVEILAHYLTEIFGLTVDSSELDLFFEVDELSERAADEFLKTHTLKRRRSIQPECHPYVVLNISARESDKKISSEQAADLVSHLSSADSFDTVVISAPEDNVWLETLGGTGTGRRHRFPEQGSAPLAAVASLVAGALCVITPDTAIVHLASAVKTPVLAFYTPLQANQEWFPYRVHHAMIKAEANRPVSAIPAGTLRQGVDEFLSSIISEHSLQATH